MYLTSDFVYSLEQQTAHLTRPADLSLLQIPFVKSPAVLC